jgi:2-C-methyl-D-erythritol 4-phosphate cytidylyltransferase
VGAWAIVVAGGSGNRFGRLKQYADLAGERVVERACATAQAACEGVVLVLPEHESIPGPLPTAIADRIVAGGPSRSASVRCGLAAVPVDAEVIVVHDAARPLAPGQLFADVIGAVRAGADGAIPAVAVTDTIKRVRDDGSLETLDRSTLVAVQTPQAFRAGVLRAAHESGADATDDAALVELLGGRVVRVVGSAGNIKITEPMDLVLATALLRVATAGSSDRSSRP